MANSLLTLISKQPYGGEDAFAGMRLALGVLVSGLVPQASVMLIGDGTLNAVADQGPGALGMPSNLEALQDLLDMGASVYCVEEDLHARVENIDILEDVNMISWAEARDIIAQHQLVTTF
ncbi:MAG: sulfur reduction protein DsrE [Euryarchaeota archaeon]|nr:sulfur reduction protein DsrE [Euryarchaeota archaeon]